MAGKRNDPNVGRLKVPTGACHSSSIAPKRNLTSIIAVVEVGNDEAKNIQRKSNA